MATNQKVVFVGQLLKSITSLAQVCDMAEDLQSVYASRGYANGGSNPIVDGDLVNGGITNISASQLGDLINVMAQMVAFRNNFPVFQSQWSTTLNAGRTDI